MSKDFSRRPGATRRYLEEVWGYDHVADVDSLTWDCIEENAEDGFLLDRILIRARRALESNNGRQ